MSRHRVQRRAAEAETMKPLDTTNIRCEQTVPAFHDLEHNSNIVKIAILGEASVGKSALAVRFLTRRFITEYSPTLESTHNHRDTVDGQIAVYRILDTAGPEVKNQSHILWADACICVYSITNKGSFNVVQDIVQSIPLTKGTTNCPCIIVGNKRDLLHFREVSESEGEAFAIKNECLFAEVSASVDVTKVRDVFTLVYREVLKRRRISMKPLSRRQKKFSIRNRFYSRSVKSIPKEEEDELTNNT